jgi:NAD+ diphosphatase
VADHPLPALPDLALSRAVVDRDAGRRTDRTWLAAAWRDPATRVVRLRGSRVAVTGDPPRLDLGGARPDVEEDARFFLGQHDGVAYFAAVLQEEPGRVDGGDEPAAAYRGLREVGAVLDDLGAGLLVHAVSLANWHAIHRRCPRCGEPTRPEHAGHTRRCVADGSEHYPRTDPAVIMLVVDDDDRLLLGRQVTWPEGRFSTLAGFVEPGESLEAAVRREVHEEVGIDVVDVTYLGSQPWPFPSSLMLGFTARATSTEVHRHDGEIAEARWYTRDGMLTDIRSGALHVSPSVSISRRLVEHWYGGPLPHNAEG